MNNKPKILIIDDEKTVRWAFSRLIDKKGIPFVLAADGTEGLEKFRKHVDSLNMIIVDIKMPGLTGLELLDIFKKEAPELPVVIITAFGGMDSTINAMKSGAYDLLTKPFDNEQLSQLIDKIMFNEKNQAVKLIDESLDDDLELEGMQIPLIGKSPKMQDIFKVIGRVAPQNISVLITGETGVGKELIAKLIHFHSPRISFPFIPINCTSIPESLIESELFGHVKGAFTGAINNKIGKFELADKGTLFLDEIGDMDYNLQSKLLRILQSNEFCKVGGNKSIKVDVRIVSATNKNLEESIEKNLFRSDLYHRLKVISINVPSLRERSEDIPQLLDYFLKNSCIKRENPEVTISKDVLDILVSYPWPGNIRELKNTVESAIALAKTSIITADDLPVEIKKHKLVHYSVPMGESVFASGKSERLQEYTVEDNLELIKRSVKSFSRTAIEKKLHNGTLYETIINNVEEAMISEALSKFENNQLKTSTYLGINRNTLRNKLQKLCENK